MLKKICLYEVIENFIDNKLEQSELIFLIRKKLTKKEFKILNFACDKDIETSEILRRLKLDEKRYRYLLNSALSKIKELKID